MRIRPRLTLYAVVVTVLGLCLAAGSLLVLARAGAANDQDEALQAAAVALAGRVAEQAADFVPVTPPVLEPSDVPVVLEVLAEDGTVLWSSDTTQPVRVPASVVVETLDTGTSLVTTDDADGGTRLATARWEIGAERGLAVAARATAAVERQVRELTGFLLIAGCIAVVSVALVSWLVIGRALRPLRSLTTAADRITASGDVSRRLPEDPHRDEVGTLTRSFNAMLARLEASQRDLAGSLDAQRRMVADASHELRTPLTTIRTNAETLRAHPDAPPADRDAAVADIADESARMSRLLDDLLLLARADADQPMLGPRRPIDLGTLVSEVARKASTPARPVSRAGSPGGCIVDGDLDALTRLLWIGVDNALRHGAGPVTLTLERDDATATCRVLVDDDGPGFPPGAEDHVFQRFWRADHARSGPGAGLGLSIARSIAEAHGGRVTAQTRPEGGARLVIELPDATAATPPAAAS